MCGILGIIDLSAPIDFLQRLSEMAEVAAHRGPDDKGIVLFNKQKVLEVLGYETAIQGWITGLGHRRLSIIDLSSAGHQPMSDASKRYWIVYNGEIYNYVELKRELETAGYIFKSDTDTEVVLYAFIEWGPDCLSRFNGMWAISIYDRKNHTLFCARDRFGIKPFYYVLKSNRFAFASEIKQLLTLNWVNREANRARLADFLFWGLETHTNETFFSNIFSLPAAHYILLSQNDLLKGKINPKQFWSPEPAEFTDESSAINAFRDTLSNAVNLRLRSDVPIGITLSGGLDSSAVTCLAGRHKKKHKDQTPLKTFNVEFSDSGFSERRFAEVVAHQSGAENTVLQPLSNDLARDWQRFIWHMEEPFSSLSFFSNYQIYQLIKTYKIPVVLSGQGGDELLLGYERYRTYDTLFKLKALRPLEAFTNMIESCRYGNMSFSKQVSYGLYFSLPWFRGIRRRHLVRPVLSNDFNHEFGRKSDHLFKSMLHKNRHSLQISELFHYQLPHLLRHEDRVSMAHSIETRLPFLDYRLLDIVLGLPMNLFFRKGWSKFLLRKAMTGMLPEVITSRTDKMGYDTPTGRLIRHNKDVFQSLFIRHRNDNILNISAIEKKLESGRLDERILCAAVTYLSWKETFLVS